MFNTFNECIRKLVKASLLNAGENWEAVFEAWPPFLEVVEVKLGLICFLQSTVSDQLLEKMR